MRKPIKEVLGKKIHVIDGAMGTFLLNEGVPADSCFEKASSDFPDKVKKVHQLYADAGADFIETNTFGGSKLKLAEFGLENEAYEINLSSVKLAREVAGEDKYVLASMGPCGKLIEPMGNVSFDEMYESFSVQAKAFKDGGADLVIVETMGDLHEVKAGVLAIKENTDLPIICSITYDANHKSMTGSDPYTVFAALSAMGVEIVGTNCGMGPDGMLGVIKEYRRAKEDLDSDTCISVMPNAGLPVLENGKAVYKLPPQEYASYVTEFVKLGVTFIGGCCGTTPDHINAVRKEVDKLSPVAVPKCGKQLTVMTSRSKMAVVSPAHSPIVIGERLNPTARKVLVEDLIEQKTDLYRKEAQLQINGDTDLLDVNVGYPDINEAEAMTRITNMLVQQFDIPLCLDSSNPMVLEAGLRAYPGKALINSVNGEEKSLNTILPLAKKYGAAIIGLTLDDSGIPKKAPARLEVARKIVQRADSLGISRNDIFIDALVLAASSNQEDAMETVKAVELIKSELGVKTSLGLSNISHGLPKRKVVNHTFMAMAFGAGLDAVIANPADSFVKTLIASSAVITGRDKNAVRYIEQKDSLLVAEENSSSSVAVKKDNRQIEEHPKLKALKEKPLLYEVAKTVVNGDSESIVARVKDAQQKYEPSVIIENGLLIGMEDVGDKFKRNIMFLPQVMASAESMKSAFSYLKTLMSSDEMGTKGTIIIATVKGDIHDIGKNIVAMMLENNGYKVVDLGKNVESDIIISSAIEHSAKIICLSSLLTTTMPEMEVVSKKIKEKGLDIKLMVGGAVVTSGYADKIAASYSTDAIGAVEMANKLM